MSKLRFIVVIFILTMLHGFYNSILTSYGFTKWSDITFLFDPNDLHADLIKVALGYISLSTELSMEAWAPLYKNYFLNNPYRDENFLGNGFLKLGGMPLTTGIYLLVKNLIVKSTPAFTVQFFYLCFFLSTFLASFKALNSLRYGLISAVFISFSYIPIFILSRGHVISAVVGFLIIFFLLFMVKNLKDHSYRTYIPLILIMTLLINLKINCIVFLSLFFLFGFRKGLVMSLISIFLSLLVFFISGLFILEYHEAWSYGNIFNILNHHHDVYVLGNKNLLFNNSLISFIKSIYYIVGLKISNYHINFALYFTLLFLTGMGIVVIFQMFSKKLNLIEYIFSILAIYILATPTFHINYLFFLYGIIFLHICNEKIFSQCRYIIIVTIFLLIPKHYFSFYFFESSDLLSIESLLNPLVLICCLFYITIRHVFPNSRLISHE